MYETEKLTREFLMGNFNFFMARTGKKIVKEIEYGVVVCET